MTMPRGMERPDPLVYRVADVAALLLVSESELYRRVKAGEVPALRWGRQVRIPKWWVDERIGGRV